MQSIIHSEAGHRHVNEDRAQIVRHPSGLQLCVLADGMGGQAGGAQAASVAVRTSTETALALSSRDLRRENSWLQVLSAADDAVEAEIEAGCTTLIAFCIGDDFVCGASCGDSAVLLLNDKPKTLTSNQRKNPPIGSSVAQPVAFSHRLQAPWKVLAMSDGVWKFAGWDLIIETCHTFSDTELILRLRQLAAGDANRLPDDFTIALFES